jgi:hypothetical protein
VLVVVLLVLVPGLPMEGRIAVLLWKGIAVDAVVTMRGSLLELWLMAG